MGYIVKFEDCGLVLHEPTDNRIAQEGAILKPMPIGFTVVEDVTRYQVYHLGVPLKRCHYLPPAEKLRSTYQNSKHGTWKNQRWEPNQWIIVSTSEFCIGET